MSFDFQEVNYDSSKMQGYLEGLKSFNQSPETLTSLRVDFEEESQVNRGLKLQVRSFLEEHEKLSPEQVVKLTALMEQAKEQREILLEILELGRAHYNGDHTIKSH